MVSIIQVIYDGISFGSVILLGAVGLSLLYGIGNFANFAHGELLAIGAYVTFVLFATLELHFLLAATIAVIFTAILGVGIDRTILQYHRESSSLTTLLITVGVAFIIRSVIRIIWTNEPKSYSLPLRVGSKILDTTVEVLGFSIELGLRVTEKSAFIVVLGIVFAGLTHIFLTRSKTGVAMRATAANRSLSRISGINTDYVASFTWFLSAGLAAIAGIFLAYSSGLLYPRMGFDVLLLIFAAVILGGIGSPYGAMIGAYLIGIAQEMSILIPGVGSRYRLGVAFMILFMTLLVKPTGIAGGEWSK